MMVGYDGNLDVCIVIVLFVSTLSHLPMVVPEVVTLLIVMMIEVMDDAQRYLLLGACDEDALIDDRFLLMVSRSRCRFCCLVYSQPLVVECVLVCDTGECYNYNLSLFSAIIDYVVVCDVGE